MTESLDRPPNRPVPDRVCRKMLAFRAKLGVLMERIEAASVPIDHYLVWEQHERSKAHERSGPT